MHSNHRKVWWKTCIAAALALGVAGGASAATYITTTDNENNAHTGVADDDMAPNTYPPCVMNNEPTHPVEFNINVTGAAPTKNAYLAVYIQDIDWPNEKDEVFLNGHSLGFATGEDQLDGSTLFIIPDASWVKPGNNLVEIHVDTLHVAEYCAPVRWGQLIVDEGLGTGTASIRTLTSDANAYAFNDTVNVNLEVDTSLPSQTVSLELTLRDPSGAIVAFDTNVGRDNWVLDGTSDEPYTWSATLPATGPQGNWQVLAAVYDQATKQFQGLRTISFAVPQAASVIPSLMSITPSTAPAGAATAVTITGSNFVQGATSCTLGSTPLLNVSAVTGTTVTANVDPFLAIGQYDVSCTTANGTGSLSKGMTLTGPLPTVTAVAPTTAPAGVATPIAITGTNFVVGATSCAIGSYALTNVVTVNSTTVTGNVAVNAPAGVYPVNCTTAAGTGTLPNGMTLTGTQQVAVTAITPNAATAGAATSVTVTGSNFAVGATSCAIGSYTLTNQSSSNTTTVTGNIPTNAPAGTYSVTCSTALDAGTLTNGFTLNPGAALPTVSGISPASAAAGAATPVTISGSNFVAGATSCTVGGTALGNLGVVNGTTINGQVSAALPAGVYDVSCTTTAGTGTLPKGMTLTAAVPTLAPFALALLAGALGLAGGVRRRVTRG